MSTVSVHIVTYNSESDIGACLEAVMRQSYAPQDIVVIDNNSTDGTKEILAQYPDIRAIFNHENRGFAGAHNQAIRMTQSDYVLVLNPDVTLHPDYLLHLAGWLDKHAEYGSAAGLLIRREAHQTVDSTGLMMHKNRQAKDRGSGEEIEQFSSSGEVFGVSGAAAMYRRQMIDDISWNGQFFDEDFFAYKEDVDVAWRAQWMGWKAYFLSSAVGYHERGWKEGTRRNQPLFVRRLSYINRYKMICKNDLGKYVWKHFPYIAVYEAASLGYALLREPKLLSAWADLVRKWPELQEKRKWIHTRRKVHPDEVYKYFN